MSKKELNKLLQDLRTELDKLGEDNNDVKIKIDTLATSIKSELWWH